MLRGAVLSFTPPTVIARNEAIHVLLSQNKNLQMLIGVFFWIASFLAMTVDGLIRQQMGKAPIKDNIRTYTIIILNIPWNITYFPLHIIASFLQQEHGRAVLRGGQDNVQDTALWMTLTG